MPSGTRVGRLFSEVEVRNQQKALADVKKFADDAKKLLNFNDTGLVDLMKLINTAVKQSGTNLKSTAASSNALANSWRSLRNEASGLRNQFVATGEKSQTLTQRLEQIKNEALGLAAGLDKGSAGFLRYNAVAANAQRTLDGLEGRMSRLGIAQQFSLGVTNSLSSAFYRLGPIGVAASYAIEGYTRSVIAASASTATLITTLAPLVAIFATVAATVGVSAAASAAIIQLEQAEANVAKTTNLTNDELERLRRNLQAQSLLTGTATKDLDELAAVAGQLGVRGVKNLSQFTDTLNRLSIATDVVGEEGASQLARFLAATQTSVGELGDVAERTGNVLNLLENNLATTAGQILDATTYTNQLGLQFGLSRDQILAFTAALSSLGVQPEGGGSGLVKFFEDLRSAVAEGSKELTGFAKIAGLTEDQFRKLFRDDASEAAQKVLLGLRNLSDAGVDLADVLNKLGISELRERRAVISLAAGYDNLEESLNLVNDETQIANSLNAEVERQLNTVNGQWRILRARVGVAAQVLGEAFLPILRGAIDLLNRSGGAIGYTVAGLTGMIAAFRTGYDYIYGFGQGILGVFVGIANSVRVASDQISNFFSSFQLVGEGYAKILTGRFQEGIDLLAEAGQAQRDAFDFSNLKDEFITTFDRFAVPAADRLIFATQRAAETYANLRDIVAATQGKLADLNNEADANIEAALFAANANSDLEEVLGALGDSSETTGKKVKTIQDVFDELQKRLESAPKLKEALGEDFDETKFKADALTSAITELILEFGVDPSQDSRLMDAITLLGTISQESADKIAEVRRQLEELQTAEFLAKATFDLNAGNRDPQDIRQDILTQIAELDQLSQAAASENRIKDLQSYEKRKDDLRKFLGDVNNIIIDEVRKNVQEREQIDFANIISGDAAKADTVAAREREAALAKARRETAESIGTTRELGEALLANVTSSFEFVEAGLAMQETLKQLQADAGALSDLLNEKNSGNALKAQADARRKNLEQLKQDYADFTSTLQRLNAAAAEEAQRQAAFQLKVRIIAQRPAVQEAVQSALASLGLDEKTIKAAATTVNMDQLNREIRARIDGQEAAKTALTLLGLDDRNTTQVAGLVNYRNLLRAIETKAQTQDRVQAALALLGLDDKNIRQVGEQVKLDEIVTNLEKQMANARLSASLLGDSSNLLSNQISLVESAIRSAIDQGYSPLSSKVKELIELHDELIARQKAIQNDPLTTEKGQDDYTKQLLLRGLPNAKDLSIPELYDALVKTGQISEEVFNRLFGERKGLTELSDLFRRLAGSVDDFTGSLLNGTADIIDGFYLLADGSSSLETRLSAVTQIANGLGNVFRAFTSEGASAYDIFKSLASIGAEIAGLAAGIPGLGQVVNATLSAVEPILGRLDNGLANIEKRVKDLTKQYDLLSESTIRAIRDMEGVTKETARGGLLGLFDPTITEFDEQVLNQALSLADQIANAYVGALSGANFGDAMQEILKQQILTAFALDPEVQAEIASLVEFLLQIIQDGVTQDEIEEFKRRYAALDQKAKQDQAAIDQLLPDVSNTKTTAGLQVNEITGETRDLFLDLFTPLAVLPSLSVTLIESRNYLKDIRDAIIGSNNAAGFSVAGVGGPVIQIYQQPGQSPTELARILGDQLRFKR